VTPATSVDDREVERFRLDAAAWWDPAGGFAELHRLNPVRLGFMRERMVAHFAREPHAVAPFGGLSALDIGCGGGLLSEPLTRLGLAVSGIDPAGEAVAAATSHARDGGLEIDYRATTAEALAAAGERFDVVAAMEVVEHVADPAAFIATAAGLVAPGGILFAATINRTVKSFALAIVGAEYVLGWVPRGTHRWEKFVTPAEIAAALGAAGFAIVELAGIVYNPFGEGWQRGRDTDVNYMLAAKRAG
jgi:2-polyprenyl-6-hydroxyphenyl methylase/3-demethylubiquinone-9 3-methyltransferase